MGDWGSSGVRYPVVGGGCNRGNEAGKSFWFENSEIPKIRGSKVSKPPGGWRLSFQESDFSHLLFASIRLVINFIYVLRYLQSTVY